jgi:hypothetical protein
MSCRVQGCQGDYDFDHITEMAKKRFIDGIDTISLLQQAKSQQEKEEIVLIGLVHLEDKQINEIRLNCPHELSCQVVDCRQRLKRMFEQQLQS